MQIIQAPVSELGESNIFEEFYELIEKHRLNASNDFEIEGFYHNLANFDLEYQQFSTTSSEQSNAIVYSYISHCLYCFLVLFKFKGFTDRPIYWAFNRYIKFSTILLKNSNKIKDESFYFRNVSQNFPFLWEGNYVNFLKEEKINLNLISIKQFERYFPLFEYAEEGISKDFGCDAFWETGIPVYKTNFGAYCHNHEVLKLTWNDKNDQFEEGDTSYEMTIDFGISDRTNDAAILIQSLYLIINALSNIDNVKIAIEEIKVGSLIGRIRLYIKNLFAKEEVKAVLETAKEAVGKALTGGEVSHAETKKVNAEIEKTKKETELLEKELKDKPSDCDVEIIHALILEKVVLENEQLKVKIAKEKLEIIDKLSDLVVKGVLGADEVRIDINGILYLLKTPAALKLPETDIDEIA
ncbi:hypothetical protein GFS24_28185 [Chitinophaga sp. SYP-B3965]|uniref:hypothetical protein n=1 Tax=Chitinophaga sp. SYP-B3965 TaxID=2663120 RepID=UPI001299FF8E|nr:hypothetical protein [Chitinophaga sp. SYP-B3965]MRG49021.1 hypothetical protein [Chitinophaga sp. SYP-B3965]